MTAEDSSTFEPSVLLFTVVKILSDKGLKKTLKKLRKETNCRKLKEKYLPEEIKKLNFEKSVSKLIKKQKKKQKKIEDNNKPVEGSTKVLNGFVKSLNGLEVTFEKKEETLSTHSNHSNGPDYEDKNDNNQSDVPASGIPFKRIHDEEWLSKIEKEELKVNSYKMKDDNFALKAAKELGSVKGKDFKVQKHKKKRSSWHGSGEITNSVNSVIFSDSDS